MTILLRISFFFLLATQMCFGQCQIKKQSDFTPPQKANKIPIELKNFGHTRVDNYFYLKDKTNPEVIKYLEEENAYCDLVMNHTKPLQEKLFNEMKSRIKEDDESVPYYDNGYYYYYRTETGNQYPIHCRKKVNLEAKEEVLFDVNKMAENYPAFVFGDYEISKDNNLAIYASNTTGSWADYTIRVKDLTSSNELPVIIDKVASYTIANDNKILFYYDAGSFSYDELLNCRFNFDIISFSLILIIINFYYALTMRLSGGHDLIRLARPPRSNCWVGFHPL